MQLICDADTNQTGPSFNYLVNETTFIVRQGRYLSKFVLGETEPCGTLELPEYQNHPCAVWNQKFYEIKQTRTYVVDLENWKIEGSVNYQFLMPTINNPYIQFDNSIMIQNGPYLYALYLDRMSVMPIAELPCTQPNLLLVLGFTSLGIVCDNCMYTYDTAKHLVTQTDKPEFRDARGTMYDDDHYFIFGPVSSDLKTTDVYKVSLKDNSATSVYSNSASISKSMPFISGPYCFFTDSNGHTSILQDDEIFQTMSDRDQRLRFKSMNKFIKAEKVGDIKDEFGNPWSDVRTPENMIVVNQKPEFTAGVPDYSQEPDEQQLAKKLLEEQEAAAKK